MKPKDWPERVKKISRGRLAPAYARSRVFTVETM